LPRTDKWELALRWSLPITKFLAVVSAMLMTVAIMMAVALSLIGRLGGMAGLLAAFFWSTVLLAMVVPWQQVLPGSSLACGALFNLGELAAGRAQWGGPEATWQQALLYYGRFLAYPLAAMSVWLIVHVKFAFACGQMHFPHAVAPVAGPGGIVAAPPSAATPPEAARPPAAPATKSLAQRALDEKSAAGTGKPPTGGARSLGPLTERFLGPKADGKSDTPSK
jgi:hypothetical protein